MRRLLAVLLIVTVNLGLQPQTLQARPRTAI